MAADVIYLGNTNTGGVVPVDANNPYAEGVEVTVLGNTGLLVKTDFRFLAWNTEADGSGTTYNPGDTFDMPDAQVDLYAQWGELFAVTYNGNGATGGLAPTDANYYIESEEVTVLGNTGSLVKTGEIFRGWNTKADGTGVTYLPGAKFAMPDDDVTLYAIWEDVPDTEIKTRAVNSATFTVKHKVTAEDEVAGGIIFDFQTNRDLVGAVTVVSGTGAIVVANLAVSYPGAGKIKVSGAGVVEDAVINVVAGINCLDPDWKAN